MIPVNERYQRAVDYHSYHLVDEYQGCNDDVASKIQKLRKRLAILIKDQAYHGKDCTPVINFLTEFKQACNSLRIQKGAVVWLITEFMNCPSLATIKA